MSHKLKRRLAALAQRMPKPSIFPDWPPATWPHGEDLEGMRQSYADYLAEVVTVSRQRNYPEFPEYSDRLDIEGEYLWLRGIRPECVSPTHPQLLTEEQLQAMRDTYQRHHEKEQA